MNISRRALLGTASTALAAGLSGCVYHGPFKFTSVEASIREPFESDPPVSVPVTAEVVVQNVDSRDVALRGVAIQLLDETRETLATETLGEFTWRGAAPERRDQEEHDTTIIGTTTSYTASWTLDRSVTVDAIPEWITFEVDEVWFGDDDDAAVVGKARASQPPPEFTATIRRLERGRPLPPTIESDDYRAVDLHRGVGGDAPILPTPTPTATATPEPTDRNATATQEAIDGTATTTPTDTAQNATDDQS